MPRDWMPPGPPGTYTEEEARIHREAYDAARGDWWARTATANRTLAAFRMYANRDKRGLLS
jgi:hypothetical protein